jgi:glycerol dehydrogenase
MSFSGECCDKNVEKIVQRAEETDVDLIIGVGGGKSIDTAKAAAEFFKVPAVTIPTIAATCAATSPISVMYNSKGEFQKNMYLKNNPNLVIVPPKVIAEAPTKYIQAGILDSFAKWYEGRTVFPKLDHPSLFASSSFELSKLLNEKLKNEAAETVRLVKSNQVGSSLIETTNVILFLTGVIQSLGQSENRGAAAHAVHNGLTVLEESHDLLHGIKVGYGILVHLILEDRPEPEIRKTVSLFRELEMAPSLEKLGLPSDDKHLSSVAEKAVDDMLMDHMPFDVTPRMVESAMRKLEEMMG